MLGDNIRKVRKAKSLTLAEIAEKIDSTTGSLSHIENGSRKPSLDMLDKIAESLGVTSLELMAGDSDVEEMYFSNLNKMTNPEGSKVIAKDLESAVYAEKVNNNPVVKEAEAFYNVDPDLFITMCRAKELPEEDRKMLRDLSARLLDAHHKTKRNNK